MKNYTQVLEDAQKAIDLDTNDSRGYHKKGLALFNLKEFANALTILETGQNLAENSVKKSLFDEWISKCRNELPKTEIKPADTQAQPLLVPVAQAVKYQWFQSESQVTVSIMAKNQKSSDVQISSTADKLLVKSINPENVQYDFDFNLEYPVIPDQTQIKFMSTKIEIKLKKCEMFQWKFFNISSDDLSNRLKTTAIIEHKPTYPSSSKKAKNWDALAKEAEAEEEKLEGDAALNKLFRDVYANGTDETRKAMNKSFVESGGTTLSTNWTDVGAKKLDIKPPDGMEWKKY